ncbi:hypothetical protein [Streptomyces sp. NPDC007172]|uniref:hypothetical protein n=1 Tax=Streptomyces sp. NPDC007172 TaxID=3364776 RepID=UPI00368931F4
MTAGSYDSNGWPDDLTIRWSVAGRRCTPAPARSSGEECPLVQTALLSAGEGAGFGPDV